MAGDLAFKPFSGEHACRLSAPTGSQFRRINGEREHEGKKYDVIYQKKGSKWEEQAYRYSKGTWTAAAARSHCTGHDGIAFEPAASAAPGEGKAMLVKMKNAKGDQAFSEMTLGEVAKWLHEHSDAEGNVLDEIVLFTTADISKAPSQDGEFDWVMSDYTLDRDRERVDPEGWDLKNFRKNPVLLWSHDWGRPAIGRVLNPHYDVAKKALVGRLKFDSKEVDPFAAMIGEKVKAGTIRTGSVGFRPIKVEIPDEDGDGKAPKPSERERLIFRKQELFEFSCCNIPANPSAMVQDLAANPDEGKGPAWTYDGKGFKQQRRKSDPPPKPQPPVPPEPEEPPIVDGEEDDDMLDLAAIPYADHGTMPEAEAWDAPAQMAACGSDMGKMKAISAWYDAENPDVKSSYKLPHHMGGNLKAVWRGVAAAMGALLGSRGGVSIPSADRKAVYNHLAKHYAQFEKEPPPFKTEYDMLIEEVTRRFDGMEEKLAKALDAVPGGAGSRGASYLDGLLRQPRKGVDRMANPFDTALKSGPASTAG